MDNYSLSDIKAVSDGGAFGGNSAWVLIILFAMIFGGGGLFGARGDYGQFATAASQQDILFSSKFSALDNKIDRLGNGIADATFSLNNSIKDGNNATQMKIADCCCTSQRNTDALRYDMAQMFANANATTTAQTQKILDTLAQNKIESLQGQINQLQLQNAMCGVVRYPNAMTYNAGTSPFCNCGGCGCGNI